MKSATPGIILLKGISRFVVATIEPPKIYEFFLHFSRIDIYEPMERKQTVSMRALSSYQ